MSQLIPARHPRTGPYHGINVQPTFAIDLWIIDLNQPQSVTLALTSLLSASEHARAAQFRYPQDRAHFTVAHAALRQILAATLGTNPKALTFAEGPHRKPYLTDHPFHFNLAHAGGQALLAVSSQGPLGVDLEPIRPLPDFLALAENFSAPERTALQQLAGDPALPLAFFQCWTRKEAFAKALGSGLSLPLDSFAVTFHPTPAAELHSHGTDTTHWQLCNLPLLPNFAAALVHPRMPTPPALQIHHWTR